MHHDMMKYKTTQSSATQIYHYGEADICWILQNPNTKGDKGHTPKGWGRCFMGDQLWL